MIRITVSESFWMGNMATLKDVARVAGTSVTTASRALNNYDDVAANTRALVVRVASDLGYHPNHIARSLQGTRVYAVGLVIPQLVHRYVDSFWLEFIAGVATTCGEAGFDLVLCIGKDLHAEHAHYQRLIRSRRVDGVIVCDIRVRDPRISYLRQSHAPFVAFGRVLGHDDFPWVDVDGASGARGAIEHLLALGHRRIGYLGAPRAYSFTHFRHEGYLDALFAAGIPYDQAIVVEDLDASSDPYAAVRDFLALENPPTALVACADFLAAGTLRALRSLGVRVPEDMSLVAFDDTLITQHTEPPLTSVRQDNQEIGSRVAAALIQRLRDDSQPPIHELITPSLIVRHSTAAPRKQ
jgi:DNA-binding LacI/PurR family transcriptional regulator